MEVKVDAKVTIRFEKELSEEDVIEAILFMEKTINAMPGKTVTGQDGAHPDFRFDVPDPEEEEHRCLSEIDLLEDGF